MPDEPRQDPRRHTAAFAVGTLGVLANFFLISWLNWSAEETFGPWGVRSGEPAGTGIAGYPVLPMIPSAAWIVLLILWIQNGPLRSGGSRRGAWPFAAGCWAFAVFPLVVYWMQEPS